MQTDIFNELNIKGEIFTDNSKRLIYSTDASAYREKPVAVVWPEDEEDIVHLTEFAGSHGLSLIPRGAGTSLAGQVVGNGLVVDISRHMNRILEINADERWVRVQPGIVLDELNLALRPHGLFFAPETSTSNRCVIGGMIGNNSSGLHSLIYGTTREHLLEVRSVLSDGSIAIFGPLPVAAFRLKCKGDKLENRIYRQIDGLLSSGENRKKIDDNYPDPVIVRRNTGYALDVLKNAALFEGKPGQDFNFCRLIAGSEGTLAFITEARLNLLPLPPGSKALMCVHFDSVSEAIRGNTVALKLNPGAVELMDNKILELTRKNISQRKNRFFVKGDPGAILIIEFARESMDEINSLMQALEAEFRKQKLGYHYPVITGKDIPRVWNLRKAGLGVLSNIPGDAKPVSVIEDTSVNPERLEEYIREFNTILGKHNLECVYHAHISVGELHLRPILNLKDPADVELFHTLAEETARLVRKFRGSLSGEHGDGRLRGEFIPLMVGEEIYTWFREIKKTWDPENIFNAGKITDTPPMNRYLRYDPGRPEREIDTIFDFSAEGGILRAAEKCNGTGDCRKSELIGGTMCPSFMATRDENTTTRARANILREFLTNSSRKNPFDHKEIYEVLDLCLSCKGCKSECPSNVDMAKMKGEFLQHYYDNNGIPLRTRMIAYITSLNKAGAVLPSVFNRFVSSGLFSRLVKNITGIARQRSIPLLYRQTFRSWASKNLPDLNSKLPVNARTVNLFADEFTEYNDTETGIHAVKLLTSLGYRVRIPRHTESARTFISKGLLRTARKKAIRNIMLLKEYVSPESPLLGIEPSAILGFRDEYPDLVRGSTKEDAVEIANNAFLIDEFLAAEIEAGRITASRFTGEKREIRLHGHCQQKAIASTAPTLRILSFPENYSAVEIPSGCCGMAGSFGYEKEHYDLSMKVGELVLFPAVRKAGKEVLIAAPGTSCRHQIMDGTGRKALHPVDILYEALKKDGEE